MSRPSSLASFVGDSDDEYETPQEQSNAVLQLRSPSWKYGTPVTSADGIHYWECNLCKKRYCRSSIGNARKHLRTKHRIDVDRKDGEQAPVKRYARESIDLAESIAEDTLRDWTPAPAREARSRNKDAPPYPPPSETEHTTSDDKAFICFLVTCLNRTAKPDINKVAAELGMSVESAHRNFDRAVNVFKNCNNAPGTRKATDCTCKSPAEVKEKAEVKERAVRKLAPVSTGPCRLVLDRKEFIKRGPGKRPIEGLTVESNKKRAKAE